MELIPIGDGKYQVWTGGRYTICDGAELWTGGKCVGVIDLGEKTASLLIKVLIKARKD